MRAKPDCDHATVDDCGRTALVAWTFTTGLRVSPSLAAAGLQEMRPAFALDVASKGDAITGIKRADSARVNRCSVSCDSAKDAKKHLALCINRGTGDVTIKPTRKFRRYGSVRVSIANDLARQQLARSAYPPPRVPCVLGASTRDRG